MTEGERAAHEAAHPPLPVLTEAERLALIHNVIDNDAETDALIPEVERIIAVYLAEQREQIAAALERDHDMPPNKDRRGYDFRMGWWEGVHHAARIALGDH